MEKIIQISVIQDKDRVKGGRTEIYALCENGDLWVGRYQHIDNDPKNKYKIVWTNLLRRDRSQK